MKLSPALILLLIPAWLVGQTNTKQVSELQIKYLQGEIFRQHSITGKGVKIAVIDAGFPGTDTHPALAHLFREGRILATRDFVQGGENVYRGHWHGTAVLGCVAGFDGTNYLGLAPDAQYLLARTEMNGEPAVEERNWAEAVLWAIDQGADIIQSSIGYTYHRYFPEEMDGKTSLAAKTALIAARKGVLLINSAGNEGDSGWRTLGTPADADSILTVGAIDPSTALPASYTSLGPTSDGRLKPNVCAPGTVLAPMPGNRYRTVYGTSFAAPLVAGFAACVKQLHPSASAQELLAMIENSAHLYPAFDYAHGYGVPQAAWFFNDSVGKLLPRNQIKVYGRFLTLQPTSPEGQSSVKAFKRLLYYQELKSDGTIGEFGVTPFVPYVMDPIDTTGLIPGNIPLYKKTTTKPGNQRFGPNRRHFAYPAIGFEGGFVEIPGSDSAVQFALSMVAGIRYHFKIFKGLLAGVEGNLGGYWVPRSLLALPSSEPPGEIINQSVSITRINTAGFIRFRFGQRGNYLGNWFDAGVSLESLLGATSKTVYRTGSEDGQFRNLTIRDKLSPDSWVQATPFIRFGFDRLSIRLSGALPASQAKGEIRVGLEYFPVLY